MQIYSIYDEKAEAFNLPFLQETDGLATRSLSDLTLDDRTTINHYPTDFTLYKIGTFDPTSGYITPTDKPIYIIKASNLANLNTPTA